jgi:hypothetical protein
MVGQFHAPASLGPPTGTFNPGTGTTLIPTISFLGDDTYEITAPVTYDLSGNYQTTLNVQMPDGTQGIFRAAAKVLPGPNQKYVTQVYQDLLGRTPDSQGLAYWVTGLDHGMSRAALATALTHSPEYYAANVVTPAYQQFLNRQPDNAGLAFWVQQLQNGLPDAQLEAFLIGSPEFYAQSGGTNKLWVDAMYGQLLGRPADQGGEDFWTQALSSNMTRAQAAFGFVASQEREGQHVTADYQKYLGRGPDDAGLAYWVSLFVHSAKSNEELIAGFIASDEFFRKATA